VWLRDTPMAMFTPDPANPTGEPLVYFIHSDHLNTPRVVVEFTSVSNEALLLELMKIENYVQQVGKLPPGNEIKR
jgi:hypothetical protein